LCGTQPVKYVLRPVLPTREPVPAKPSYDYLRERLVAHLAQAPARFEFFVQLRKDQSLPIEDPGVPWRGAGAPLVKVATLEIPAQTFDTAEQREFGDNLSFNPWRCLPCHRPLGGISRARRQVYRVLSAYRHNRNAAERIEPS